MEKKCSLVRVISIKFKPRCLVIFVQTVVHYSLADFQKLFKRFVLVKLSIINSKSLQGDIFPFEEYKLKMLLEVIQNLFLPRFFYRSDE